MEYVGIILTTDKRFYIGPPWQLRPGDMIGVTNACGEPVVKTVEAVIDGEYGGETMSFLEQFTGKELKRIDAVYTKVDLAWLGETEATNVHE